MVLWQLRSTVQLYNTTNLNISTPPIDQRLTSTVAIVACMRPRSAYSLLVVRSAVRVSSERMVRRDLDH